MQGEISADDPHHGPGAVGASALQKALARIQGDKAEQIMSKYTAPDEVLELPGHCLACNAEAVTRVFQTSIPYFKVLCASFTGILCKLPAPHHPADRQLTCKSAFHVHYWGLMNLTAMYMHAPTCLL